MKKNDIKLALKNIREKKPLVHHLTNYVTVNDCANVTLAIGASPVMADDIKEVKDMVALASSLVINIGTLNSKTVEAMLAAGKKANDIGVPVILDPVGAGATPYRTETAKKLLEEVKFSVIRGNLSEIKVISGIEAKTKGVDSGEEIATEEASKIKEIKEFAGELARKLDTVVVITGAIDVVADGKRSLCIKNGHKIMASVTGTGCMCTSIIGAFLGANEDKFIAAVSGTAVIGICGEMAFKALDKKEGTGSFRVKLIDAIWRIEDKHIEKYLEMEILEQRLEE